MSDSSLRIVSYEFRSYLYCKSNPIQEITMPIGARILSVAYHCHRNLIWALVDTSADKETRYFMCHGDYEPGIDPCEVYIGTALSDSYSNTIHLFELKRS